MSATIDFPTLLSGASAAFTSYFWFVKSKRERPHLQFHQLSDFRVTCRRNPDSPDLKRLWFQQMDTGGVLIVNHSARQNSIITFHCSLQTEQGRIEGEWGYGGEDKPPWNVGAESTIAFSPACIFNVPADYEPPENLSVSVEFVTVSGKNFHHQFEQRTPSFAATENRAA